MPRLIVMMMTALGLMTTPAWSAPVDDLLKTPVFAEALDYGKIPDIERCTSPNPRQEIYFYCKDSAKIYARALDNAKTQGNPLMVIFGFDNCPSCRVMDQAIFNPGRPLTNGDIVQFLSTEAIKTYVGAKEPMTINVVRIHSRSDHGLKLATEIGATQMALDRGWHRVWSPFILFVNPDSGKTHSESYWEAEEQFCDWRAELATNLEGIDMAVKGNPFTARKKCET